MKPSLYLAGAVGLAAGASYAVQPLSVTVEGIGANQPIPEQYALCKATPDGQSTPGQNMRPTISWGNAPKDTKSFAIVISDLDVPADFSKAGKQGQIIERDVPRKDFYHWALADIPPTITRIPGGDSANASDFGTPATNDLKSYLKDAHNYGGPCPPWNDARLHHYHFTVYALDVKTLNLPVGANAKDVVTTIASGKHALSQNEVVGTYTLNKDLRQ